MSNESRAGARLPLEVVEDGRVTIDEVTFALGDSETTGGRTRAFIVRPEDSAARPVVLFAHGTGIDAEYYIDEARRGARLGLAGICVDLPYRPPFPGPLYSDERDRTALAEAVTVLRQTVDLAEQLPGLDAGRIGFIGLSLGATVGMHLRAVEPRISAFALVSAVARIADYSSFPDHPATRELVEAGRLDAYLELMSEVDPVTNARAPSGAPVLLQFGSDDWLVPRSSADELTSTLGAAADARWYPAAHELDVQAQDDRLRWLADRLSGDRPTD
jgi:dienelactone hydrolase